MIHRSPEELRKSNAERVIGKHDAMSRDWRDLCNEYGELAVQLFDHDAPVDLACAFLIEERAEEQDQALGLAPRS